MNRKAILVRGREEGINYVYFTYSDALISKEIMLTSEEWVRGVSQFNFQSDVTKELKDTHEPVGSETEKIKNGYIVRFFFVEKYSFTKRTSDSIIEEYIEKWESEKIISKSQAKRIAIQKGEDLKAL